MSEQIVMVYPKLYQKYVTYDNKGNDMLYAEMNKALYCMLKSSLLFYKKMRKDLEAYGFVINPYDPCVANDVVESHQMTVRWHVDDLKVSHKDPYQITKFSSYILIIYGEKLAVKQGKVHEYLGMDLYYSYEGLVKVSMIKYTGKILRSFPEKMVFIAASPASERLFKVRDERGQIPPRRSGSKLSSHNSSATIHVQLGTQGYLNSGIISNNDIQES